VLVLALHEFLENFVPLDVALLLDIHFGLLSIRKHRHLAEEIQALRAPVDCEQTPVVQQRLKPLSLRVVLAGEKAVARFRVVRHRRVAVRQVFFA